MNKKVNVFGKGVPVFVLVLLGMGIVAAALVPYIANAVTGEVTVSAPLQINITAVSAGSFTNNPETYTANLLGGQSLVVSTKLTNKNTVDASPSVYTEITLKDVIDTEGMTVTYNDASSGDVPLSACQPTAADGNSYYYLGPFSLPANTVDQMSTITLETAPNLAPGTYISTTSVILATNKKC